MTEPTIRLPQTESDPQDDPKSTEPTVDAVENLVSRGGFEGDPREIVQNPAVTPEMLNEPDDRRVDLTDDN